MCKKILSVAVIIMIASLISCVIGQVSVAESGGSQANPDGGVEERTIATYEFTSPGWATFGIVLPQKMAYIGLRVGELITQNDIKNRWSDGSIRYVILTVKVTDTGSYAIYESQPATGTTTPTVLTADLKLDIEGQGVYQSVLPNVVTEDMWLNGPLVKEWRVRDMPEKNGVKHPFLSNVWDVRMYNDGTGTIDATVENVRDVASADAVIYSTDITFNGVAVYHHNAVAAGQGRISFIDNINAYGAYTFTADHGLVAGNFIRLTSGAAVGEISGVGDYPTANRISSYSKIFPKEIRESIHDDSWEKIFLHRYGSRWHKVFAVNGFAEAGVKIDFEPFIKANAIPEYMQTVHDAASVADESEWKRGDILGFPDMVVGMGGTGGRASTGPYPAWTMRYIVHQTPELRKQMLLNGDAAGSFAAHFTKNDTTQFVTFDENPNYKTDTRVANGNKPSNNLKGAYIPWENAHACSLAYVPYLITGRRYYSDEMLHYGHNAINNASISKKSDIYDGPILWIEQVRGFAWLLREVTDAATYLPDDNQYKEYFKSVVNRNLTGIDSIIQKEPNRVSPLGVIKLSYMIATLSSEYDYNWNEFSPWQTSYLLWSMQRAIDQGFQGGTVARDLMLKVLFEPVYKKTGYNPRYIAGYYTKFGKEMKKGGSNVWFQTWDEVFEENYAKAAEPDWGYGHVLRLSCVVAKKAGMSWADDVHKFVWNMLEEKNQLGNITRNETVHSQFALQYNYD